MLKNNRKNSFSLWQLPSQEGGQMESYVIKTSAGKLIVIDGGYSSDGEFLKRFLDEFGNHVHSWFLTHPHSDHIGALTWILLNQGDLVIDNVYASFPSVEWIQKNEPDYANDIVEFNKALTISGRETIEINFGDTFDVDKVHIEIFSDINLEITDNAINNSSIVIKISDSSKSVLFLSDLGEQAGDKLLGIIEHDKLKADYVQMAHHGQNGVKENFYKIIQPEFCLWTTPLWLWDNDNGGGKGSGPWRTLDVRKWMENLNVKSNFVSGLSSSPMTIFVD